MNPCVFSADRAYRYTLTRRWDKVQDTFWEQKHPKESFVVFIGLNPSTADEQQDDPTIRRCIAFAQRWGYPSMVMLNLFAFRATDPRLMKKATDPIGPENDKFILAFANACKESGGIVIAAWGVHGTFKHRNAEVLNLLKGIGVEVHALDKTAAGEPRHPLYLSGAVTPVQI